MKRALLIVRIALSLLVFVEAAADTGGEKNEVLLSLPGYEKKVGVAIHPRAEMVAVYRGNNLYLRPLSRKLRLLLGSQKAVATKTLSLPELIRDEAVRGKEDPFSLLISEKPFAKPTDTFSIKLKRKVMSGRFAESAGDELQMGIVLFLGKEGVHIYQFSVSAEGVSAHFHTLSKQQYKAAKKRVEGKLKAAGQKKAAKKIRGL